MNRVEEKIIKYGTDAWWSVSANQFSREGVVDDLKEIQTEQEDLQKNIDKMAYKQAKKIIEKETGVTIPHNFAEVWEAQGKIGALMNTVSFELDKRDDNRSYEQFIWDSLKQSEPVEVTQYVADWYEENKKNLDYKIWEYIYDFDEHDSDDFCKWMNVSKTKPVETLIRMQDGYKVKQEQLYQVVFLETDDDRQILFRKGKEYEIGFESENGGYWQQDFTEKEIKEANQAYWNDAFVKQVDSDN
ncbi:DUF1642 domain-containing protein [Enterococcus sp. LJL128]